MAMTPAQKRAEYAKMRRDIGDFSRRVLQLPLRAYQYEWAQYALEMVREKRNETIVVEMARQSGKNQTSAHLEVSIMAQAGGNGGGEMVKAAPTRTPQIVNSKQRFRDVASRASQRIRVFQPKPSEGYMFRWMDAGISFFSAAPEANVVGATASLLMELDEAQDIQPAKYHKDFAPMRSSTGAPIIAYGTTWTDDTLLESFKRDIMEGRVPGRIFRVDAGRVGDENQKYAEFVAQQIAQMGREHPSIRTQYFLEPLENRGRLLSRAQLVGMMGEHERQEKRGNQRIIVAGLDFAGADESAGLLTSYSTISSRDSVALTIAEAEWKEIVAGVLVPSAKILARYEWQDVHPLTIHTTLVDILDSRWKVNKLHIDATGIGATGASLLGKALDNNTGIRSTGITFDAGWNTHTRLVSQYLELVNGSRLKDYRTDFDVIRVAEAEVADTRDVTKHNWWQRGHARLEARESKRMRTYVPDGEGHDDCIVSELLCVDAAFAAPSVGKVQQTKRSTMEQAY